MPTPLETYLAGIANRTYKKHRAAIGTDNAYANPLLDGIRPYGDHMPKTLAAHCVDTGVAWSVAVNNQWVQSIIDDTAVNKIYVFHIGLNTALQNSIQLGAINIAAF